MPVLEFKFKVGGILTNATSVVLADPTSAFGVRRDDTGATLVASGTPMVHPSTGPTVGIYRYDFTPPQVDVSYTWYARVTYDGATYHFPRTFVSGVTVPVSPFHTWAEFVRRWGLGNITIASNKDNKTKEPDMDAIQDAFDFAVDEILAIMTGGVYATPLDFTPNGMVVPRQVRNWAMVIAYEYLYNGRGLDDKNKVGNKITAQLSSVVMEMGFYKAGLRQMPAGQAVASDGTPVTQSAAAFRARGPHGVPYYYFINGRYVHTGETCYG